MTEGKLMSVKEVAAYLGVHARTVQRYLAEPDEEIRLKGIMLGNRWRFEKSDVDSFLARMRARTENQREVA